MSEILTSAALALTAVALAGAFTGFLRHQVFGLVALAFALFSIDSLMRAERFWGVAEGAAAAYYGHCWWHGGGGDGMRRRLRRWARRFTPVRRTAPAGV